MSKRRRQRSSGCSFENHAGRLRLRFRIPGHAGHRARATGLPDTPGNRQRLERLRVLVGAVVRAGHDPTPVLDEHFGLRPRIPVSPPAPVAAAAANGPTVAAYYERWIAEQAPVVRRAQARDYRRHVVTHVPPYLGQRLLAALHPRDIRGLQAELLTRDCFLRLKWPKAKRPEPDPLTAAERSRVLAWFASHRFGFHPGRGKMHVRRYLHPAYRVYVHTLFWTGVRPSEAAGLQWGDIDLTAQTARVERSFHLYALDDTKTAGANRTIELTPETAVLLRQMMPLRVEPDMPVFTNVDGGPVDPNAFTDHWYGCLRALSIRVRGLYTTKDTFVSLAMTCNANPAWLEQQTGVAWATLKKHYGRYMPSQGASEMDKLRAVACEQRPMHFRGAGAAEIGSETPKIGSEVSKATLGQ